MVQTCCHIWPSSTDCQSSEGLWLARCQGGRKKVFTAALLAPGTGISESGGSRENDLASLGRWFNLSKRHGYSPNMHRGGDDDDVRHGVSTCAGVGSCLMWCRVSRVFQDEQRRLDGAQLHTFSCCLASNKTHLSSISHLVRISRLLLFNSTALQNRKTAIPKQQQTGYNKRYPVF